jgi:hypothetical protein
MNFVIKLLHVKIPKYDKLVSEELMDLVFGLKDIKILMLHKVHVSHILLVKV